MASGETYFTVHVGGTRTATVEVVGDLDAFTSAGFRAVMRAVAARDDLELDLSGCSFLDVAGARAIARIVRTIRDQGGRATVTATSRRAALALRVTGVTDELRLAG